MNDSRSDSRSRLGAAGERFAAGWLAERGLTILDTNLEFGDGELDILARDRGKFVAVEVRSIRGAADPIDAIGEGKRERVRRLASRVGATRVDFLGVRFSSEAIFVHWVPG